MDQLGTVSSEGGPFLIADARAARTWRGAEEGSRDYDAACGALEQMGRWRWGIPWHLDDDVRIPAGDALRCFIEPA